MAGDALKVSVLLEPSKDGNFKSKFTMGKWIDLSGGMSEIITVGENQNL